VASITDKSMKLRNARNNNSRVATRISAVDVYGAFFGWLALVRWRRLGVNQLVGVRNINSVIKCPQLSCCLRVRASEERYARIRRVSMAIVAGASVAMA
jgi:hypothetical protein